MSERIIPQRIADPDDPRIAPYRRVRDRDLAGRDGLFMAEGAVVVRTLLSGRSRFEADSVLLSARAAASGDLGETDAPIYVAEQAVMDAIAGFPIHRGILALGRRRAASVQTEVLPEVSPGAGGPALVVGAIGLANHDNVGGLFRNAAAFGVDAVLLDRASCDPLYRKAIRVSVGAALTVPFRHGGSADALVALLTRCGFEILALSPGGRDRLEDVAWPRRTALLVGSEGAGLPSEVLARVRSVRIDLQAGFDSLNVATASGIALHAARRGRPSPD